MALAIRNRRNPPQPRYRMGTLTWTADRHGTVRTDDGESVEVTIPNGLWCWTGNRVALYRYPSGWVAVARMTAGPGLEYQ